MSEISITRFQPAAISRDSSTSVQAVDELSGAPKSDSSTDQKGSRQDSKQGSRQDTKQAPGKSPYSSQDASSATSGEQARASSSDAGESELEQAVSKLNEYVQTVQRDIYFDLDPLSGEPSVTVLDRESRQVLRQFDSREALELASKVDTDEPISLFKTRV